MRLAANAITHFLVDALCLATLFSGRIPDGAFALAVMLYNTLAFSTQCVVGLGVDRIRSGCNVAALEAASVACVVAGFALAAPWWLSVVLIGCGNSVFHVTGGTTTLRESEGKAWPLGVFVAPGAFGVTAGMLFPQIGWVLAACALVCAAAVWASARGGFRTGRTAQCAVRAGSGPSGQAGACPDAGGAARGEGAAEAFPVLAVVLLILAVAVRAIGGSAVVFPWKTGAAAAFALTAFVFAGKTAGGFLCDRLGPARTALVSIPAAAVLIAFFWGSAPLSCVGQLLLNLTMPVTLWMMYRLMPDMPALSFGLAASALWPGTLAGTFFTLTGPALWVCVLVSFLFGLGAILFAVVSYPQTFEKEEA